MRKYVFLSKSDLGRILMLLSFLLVLTLNSFAQRQLEKLDRGVVAIYKSNGQALVTWRIFGNDSPDIGFNVYAKVNGGSAVKKNSAVIKGKSNLLVAGVNPASTNQYFVKPVIGGVEGEASNAFTLNGSNPFLSVALDIPTGGTTPDNVDYTYSAGDCSVGDLDGDGDYEIIVKWDPSNAKDNAHSGHTGSVIFDAYTLEGTKLWRIDLGKNIRAGAHYTQFMVYDLDGDGKAELACKTADGTVDGKGNVIGDANVDYRNGDGKIITGPEFLTVFNGLTGEIITTTQYYPQRYPGNDNPTAAQMETMWGDSYGNRIDRFLSCVAYLDGIRPSLVMCRGYYTRTVLAAYDFRNGQLSTRWVFDSEDEGNEIYEAQGNHQLSVNDVDGDGKDEIVYGSMVVDNNGEILYSTGRGHGDAMHVSDFIPSNPGLEMFSVHEHYPNVAGVEMRKAGTGEDIWIIPGYGDIGRGVAFDIDPTSAGAEAWASDGSGIHACASGHVLTTTYPTSAGNGWSYNMGAWWDGDLLRELVDRTVITKWNWNTKGTDRLFTVYSEDVSSNNGSKYSPCLVADFLGDWREEIIFKKSNSTELRIFSTAEATSYGMYTLMHDCEYRMGIAWQNVGYNQPAHTSFFLGADMSTPPTPDALYTDAANPFNPDETVPVLAALADQELLLETDCQVLLPDFSSYVELTDEKVAEIRYFQTPAAGTIITAENTAVDVSMYVDDGYGNTSNVIEFKVTAVDKTAPVFTSAFPDHPIRSTGNCQGTLPDYTKYVKYEDNCSDEITVTMAPAAGTILSGDGDTATVTVTITDENGLSTDSTWLVTLNASGCYPAAVDETSLNAVVSVSPNPAANYISIDVASDVTVITANIITINGDVIVPLTAKELATPIAIKQLSAGVYFVKIITQQGVSNIKFIKK